MNKRIQRATQLILFLFVVVLPFQNCSKTSFGNVPTDSTSTVGTTGTATTTPTVPPVVPTTPTGTLKTKSVQISSAPNKVDFLLVVDNSGSMEDDALSLANRLSSFFSYLNTAQMDWQMCVITTNPNSVGQSYAWLGTNSIILNSRTANIQTVVPNTIKYLFDQTNNNGDERGVAQAYWHLTNNAYQSCYRDGALFAPIFISDEDERSAGYTDYSYVSTDPEFYNTRSGPIESVDLPTNYLNEFRSRYPNKKIQSHAIVIKSGDQMCFGLQDYYSNVSFGTFYESLANATQGSITSICESDYTNNLNRISAQVVSLSQNLLLECTPGSLTLTVSPQDPNVKYTVLDRNLALSYPSNKSYTVTVKYMCK